MVFSQRRGLERSVEQWQAEIHALVTASDLVEIARQQIRDGIAHEEATVPAERRQCGGKVDVMLVDKDGARLV
jgi:hypothetical protein